MPHINFDVNEINLVPNDHLMIVISATYIDKMFCDHSLDHCFFLIHREQF